jgi:glycylpeptide N-tetradecanoyltransferase
MFATKKVVKEGMMKPYPKDKVPIEPVALPEGFEWETFDIMDDAVAIEITDFLNMHYVSDPDGHFILKYSVEKFRWVMCTPGWFKDLHYCVRNSKNKKVMAVFMSSPKKFLMNDKPIHMIETNFLAVHSKLRGKRMA